MTTLTESERDTLLRELGVIASTDDVVWNYLQAAVGRCSEREALILMVKHLVLDRRELMARLPEWVSAPVVRFPREWYPCDEPRYWPYRCRPNWPAAWGPGYVVRPSVALAIESPGAKCSPDGGPT